MQRAHSGRARISARRPRAMGECDRTGFWYSRDQMVRQFQWAGNKLIDTGLLVGPDQVDVPQDQFRSLILPPDPIPVLNPRPSPNVTGIPIVNQPLPTSPGNHGFTQLIVGGASIQPYYPTPVPPSGGGTFLTDEFGNPITDEFGNLIAIDSFNNSIVSASKARVLALIAQLTGVPTPAQIFDRSVLLTPQLTSVSLMGTQTGRNWLLLYCPVVPQVQIGIFSRGGSPPVAPGSAPATIWGRRTNLILGPGEAYFWATDQGLGQAWQGALSVIGLWPGLQFWAWESPGSTPILTDEYGAPITDEYGNWIVLS